jgi:hypothetical protein
MHVRRDPRGNISETGGRESLSLYSLEMACRPQWGTSALLVSRISQSADVGLWWISRNFLLNRCIIGCDPYTANLDHAHGQDPKRMSPMRNGGHCADIRRMIR